MARIFLSCNGAAQMISESQEERLPALTSMGLSLHLATCGHCRRYLKQVRLLRTVFSSYPDHIATQLPDSTIERMVARLRERS
jgi:hypothetical protein